MRLLGCDKVANKEDIRQKLRESKSKIEISQTKKPTKINRKELLQNGYVIPPPNRSKRAYLNGFVEFSTIIKKNLQFFPPRDLNLYQLRREQEFLILKKADIPQSEILQ